ncbi:MAG: DUF3078 domain-containing protein [Maribacter sp.]|nr:DUF3078 domain-containing protein [Maribacter sp.]
MLRTPYLLFVFIIAIPLVHAQDKTRPTSEADSVRIDSMTVDTVIVDTIVIRRPQERVQNIKRGVTLNTSVISFKKTKPLDKGYKKFQIPSFWQSINLLGLNFSEVAFVNWNAGGNNSVSALGSARFERNYKFRYLQWENYMELRYGVNAQDNQKLLKTDDAIRFSSTFGYRQDTITNWYYSVKANFNTQFSNGYKYPDRASPISRFMSPGYSFLGAGTSYISAGGRFNLYFSPLTQKATFVLDQNLADQGAFGVEKAVLDADGNVLVQGKHVFLELGFLISNNWETEVYKNMALKHRLSLYTDYLRNFGNIDVDWELNIDLRVNEFIMTTIGTHILYDNDILFDPIKNAEGVVLNDGKPRIQFKQLLGVGVSYNF